MSKAAVTKAIRRKVSESSPPTHLSKTKDNVTKRTVPSNSVLILLLLGGGVFLLYYVFLTSDLNRNLYTTLKEASIFYDRFFTREVAGTGPGLRAVPKEIDLSPCETLAKYAVVDHNETGLHAVCVVKHGEKIFVTVKKNLNKNIAVNFTLSASVNMRQLRDAFDTLVIDRRPTSDLAKKYQPAWQLYNMEGQKVETIDQALTANSLFLMEGGMWVYPAVKVGFVQHAMLDIGGVFLTTLSVSPVVLQVSRLLTDDDINYVIKAAAPSMHSSGITPNEGQVEVDPSQWRTSSNTWLTPDPVVDVIDRRVSVLTHVPTSHQEWLQVLKYTKGQQYVAHHDYFNLEWLDKDVIKSQRWEEKLDQGYANRLATVLWYMSEVEEGGETWFAQTKEIANTAYPDQQCKSELMVKPVKGGAIIFYNMLPNGELDVMSKHAGCPVIKGTKHAANKWVWSKPFPAY